MRCSSGGSAAALSLSAASYGNVPGSNERVRVAFLGCGGRAQAHIDLVNRFAREGKPVAAVAVCDVWDGLEDEYDVHFGGKVTRRRYSQGLHPSARGAKVRLANGKVAVTDGPFAEAKELIAGFALVKVASKQEAIGLAQRMLQIAGEGEAEVREVVEA